MANTERTAQARWSGDLPEGSGVVEFASGALSSTPVTWAARTESSNGKTSPEELVAAAHASCYAMAFSHVLATAGHNPEQVHVTATVGFGPKEGGGGFEVKSSTLNVRGTVAGLDQATFEKLANEGEQGCPISNALRGNIDITVNATLES
ncbi:MAG: OsmC family peroxiredoxin [Chloroflexia bacterium]|nr:OsmC family peroxiredoxin [Chloroflexia bacterium]